MDRISGLFRFRSHRGHELLGDTAKERVLTVELYCKWHELWLILPSRNIVAVQFSDLEEWWDGSTAAYVDHVPNPEAVRAFAECKGYVINELAEELMEGRWKLEVLDNR